MNFLDNITFRRARTQSDSKNTSEQINDSFDEQTDFNESSSSLPDLSKQGQNELINSLKQQVKYLELQLNSAHQEIDSLSLENTNLKKLNQGLCKKNEVYKTLTCSPIKSTKNNTPQKQAHKRNKQTQTETSQILEMERLDQSLENNQESRTTSENSANTIGTVQDLNKQNKICIISSNNRNSVLKIAKETFQNAQICHYCYPNCGITQLLNNIDQKLANYTMADYCTILIGEEDFRKTNYYFDLIKNIRETLLTVQHTNIIICLPTFKLNNYSAMYNGRIEIFNNLLYLDMYTHNYAILFDSNLDLTWDYSVFGKDGILNINGMKNIFSNLKYTVQYEILSKQNDFYNVIKNCNITQSENNSKINLFRS